MAPDPFFCYNRFIMAVLYRKYRPQTFGEVLGQKHVVKTLQNQVVAGSVAHAYLFTGGRGIGKTSIARILAKAVNCENISKIGDPDGTCSICKQIEAGQFMDLVEIDAASNTGVDNIRDLIDHVKFSPSVGKYKVFIIDEVHMLSKGAFNALLKTLEEPPKHAIFVLATTEINKVPATIISRTQRFDYIAPSQKDLAEYLQQIVKKEKLKVSKDILELVASGAQGSVRDSLSLLDKVLSLGDDPSLEDCLRLLGVTDIALSDQLLSLIIDEKASEISLFFDALTERGVDFTIFNKDFLEHLRKLLIQKIGGGSNYHLPEEHQAKLVELANSVSLQEIILVTRLFLKSFKDLASSPSPEIPLLLAALESATRKRQQPASQPAAKSAPAPLSPPVVTSSQIEQSPPPPPVTQFAFTQVLQPTVGAPQVAEEVIEIESVDEGATILDIQDKWSLVIDQIKVVNSPLGNLVKNSPVQKVEKGRIFLGVKFLFHKQNLESQKNLKLICEAVKKVTGKQLGLCAQIIKDDAITKVEPAEVLTDALRILGGELIE